MASTAVELWKTDGTAGGTVLVKDINPGAAGSNIKNLVNVNGTLYFSANDGTHGNELWKSDGTAAGTVLVEDINQRSVDSNPANFTVLGNSLLFTADDGFHGTELWKLPTMCGGRKFQLAPRTWPALQCRRRRIHLPITPARQRPYRPTSPSVEPSSVTSAHYAGIDWPKSRG